MNRSAVGTSSIELKSKRPRLSVRIVSYLLTEPFVWQVVGLVILFKVFGG